MAQTGPSLPRRRFHRGVFVLAGVYNAMWGLYAALDPQWLFRLSDMPLMRHPQIFVTLGMVLGLYGILFLDVARVPESGWLVVAVALVGKILGPIGVAVLVASGEWPPAAVVLVLTNDLIWWLPFGLYLHDAWPFFRAELAGDVPGLDAT